ncbi:prepilin-type N-terminal cleavage/methylation domain-containing protein [Candidatus Peregrinibacteria bacterium]|nr:prepilin-type N-terminal cleavage/methylation domain-containing protein [Candidatus Peregrinibacteria bacterium]
MPLNRFRLPIGSRGFTLMELMVAIAIFATISAGVAVPIIGSHLSGLEDRRTFRVNTLLTESWEAVRSIRNRNWSELSDGAHGLNVGGGHWVFSGNSDIQDGISRVVTLSTAQRNVAGALVEVGGTPDPDTKKVSILLSWQPPYSDPRTLMVESLLTNHQAPGDWPIPVP